MPTIQAVYTAPNSRDSSRIEVQYALMNSIRFFHSEERHDIRRVLIPLNQHAFIVVKLIPYEATSVKLWDGDVIKIVSCWNMVEYRPEKEVAAELYGQAVFAIEQAVAAQQQFLDYFNLGTGTCTQVVFAPLVLPWSFDHHRED